LLAKKRSKTAFFVKQEKRALAGAPFADQFAATAGFILTIALLQSVEF